MHRRHVRPSCRKYKKATGSQADDSKDDWLDGDAGSVGSETGVVLLSADPVRGFIDFAREDTVLPTA